MKGIIILLVSLTLLSCSKEKEEVNKSPSDTTQTKKDVKKDSANNWAKELTNENAKETVNNLLKIKGSLVNWMGLLKYSDYEVKGRATIDKRIKGLQYPDGSVVYSVFMNGDFVFHKDINDFWVLDRVEFIPLVGSEGWSETVYAKVLDK